jgi:hypothetical protein
MSGPLASVAGQTKRLPSHLSDWLCSWSVSSGWWGWLSDGGGLTRFVAVDHPWSDLPLLCRPSPSKGPPV